MTTALIVDDDNRLAKTLTDFLRLGGVDSVSVTDTADLAEVTASVSPDVIVLDLMLAALSGVELAAELRAGPFASIPRIAVSSSPFLLEIAEESGLFDYVIGKPIDFEQLLVLIEESAGQTSTERS